MGASKRLLADAEDRAGLFDWALEHPVGIALVAGVAALLACLPVVLFPPAGLRWIGPAVSASAGLATYVLWRRPAGWARRRYETAKDELRAEHSRGDER